MSNIIGMDEGKGSLKLTLTLSDMTKTDSELKKTKRGGLIKKDDKQYSVKSNFLLALVYKVPESYTNIQVIFEKTKLNEISNGYFFTGDMKLLNIVCGLGNHSSKYPCIFCNAHKLSSVLKFCSTI